MKTHSLDGLLVSQQVYEGIEAVAATGLYGTTPEEVVERLLSAALIGVSQEIAHAKMALLELETIEDE